MWLLVLGVWGSQRGLGRSLWMRNRTGWSLQGCEPRSLLGSSKSCAGGSALLGWRGWSSQNSHG